MTLLQRIFGRAQPVEKRAMGSGFTAALIAARESYISGSRGVAELTATVQACVGLWEGAFALADVRNAPQLDRATMALIARSLALRGEAVFLIRDRLVPAADWDLRTRQGVPVAYRVSVSEAGGGTSETALAGEVLHVRIGADPATPWAGTSPLRRASITADMLHALESALAETYENAPLGSMVVPFPEAGETDRETLARGFRGRRGRVLLRESVTVTAAGGPAPASDWKPQDLTPDMTRAMPLQALEAARGAVCAAFGVLPALMNPATTGPVVREAQRHLGYYQLQPLAALLAEEATAKLGQPVEIDVLRPVQAFDLSGRARAVSTMVEALGRAKELGLSPEELNAVLSLANWGEGDNAA